MINKSYLKTWRSNMSASEITSISDSQRLKQVSGYHGLRMMLYFSVFAAMDAWFEVSSLVIANILSIVAALIVGTYLSSIFHEWGHFIGARISKSRSPMVRKPKGIFIFGFDMKNNTPNQFLWMSIGGPLGNLTLISLVYFLIPFDNFGRTALFALVVGKLVAVIVFEGPIILRAFLGGNPQEELDKQLGNGAIDIGQISGYLVTALVWAWLA